MATWGVVKDGFDRMKANRELLGKKKTARELFREEIEKRGTNLDKVNLAELKERVTERLKRQRADDIRIKVTSGVVLTALILGISWIVVAATSGDSRSQPQKKDNSELFTTYHDLLPDSSVLKTDYFPGSTKAAETILQNGLRQQRSVSYYESGEKFRSALYFNDTLILETYFYKSGDTIRRFPGITDDKVYKITMPDPTGKVKIEFDFYDGKMVSNTYKEVPLK